MLLHLVLSLVWYSLCHEIETEIEKGDTPLKRTMEMFIRHYTRTLEYASPNIRQQWFDYLDNRYTLTMDEILDPFLSKMYSAYDEEGVRGTRYLDELRLLSHWCHKLLNEYADEQQSALSSCKDSKKLAARFMWRLHDLTLEILKQD